MNQKQKYLLPAVSTLGALYGCAKHKVPAFFAEDCLYVRLYAIVQLDPRFACYRIIFCRSKKIIVFQKVIGKNRFDSARYEMYIPFYR